jgi:hypothetical protein
MRAACLKRNEIIASARCPHPKHDWIPFSEMRERDLVILSTSHFQHVVNDWNKKYAETGRHQKIGPAHLKSQRRFANE